MDESSRFLTGWLGVRIPPSALQTHLPPWRNWQRSRLLTGWFRVRVSTGAAPGIGRVVRHWSSKPAMTGSIPASQTGASSNGQDAGLWHQLRRFESCRPKRKHRGRLMERRWFLTPAMKVRSLPPVWFRHSFQRRLMARHPAVNRHHAGSTPAAGAPKQSLVPVR
jgi:hypothetical protein